MSTAERVRCAITESINQSRRMGHAARTRSTNSVLKTSLAVEMENQGVPPKFSGSCRKTTMTAASHARETVNGDTNMASEGRRRRFGERFSVPLPSRPRSFPRSSCSVTRHFSHCLAALQSKQIVLQKNLVKSRKQ